MRPARAGMRDRWRIEVIRNHEISEAARSLMLVLVDEMTDAGRISMPRNVLAEQFDVHPRRITQRVADAVSAGLLSKCGGGYKGMTAQYEALIPPRKGRRITATNKGGEKASTNDVKVDAKPPPNDEQKASTFDQDNSDAKVAGNQPPNAGVTYVREQTNYAATGATMNCRQCARLAPFHERCINHQGATT